MGHGAGITNKKYIRNSFWKNSIGRGSCGG